MIKGSWLLQKERLGSTIAHQVQMSILSGRTYCQYNIPLVPLLFLLFLQQRQCPGNNPIKRWIASQHSLTSTSQHGGMATPSAPAVASSLKNSNMKGAWHGLGAHRPLGIPLHDTDLVNNSDLLQELMQIYGIVGVSVCACTSHHVRHVLVM